jgi:hypothetical protein
VFIFDLSLKKKKKKKKKKRNGLYSPNCFTLSVVKTQNSIIDPQ